MRNTQWRSKFKRDFKREEAGIHSRLLEPGGVFEQVLFQLSNNQPLDEKYRDHALHGNWEGYRECHLRPNLLLVYALEGDELLRLERLGSHSEIFGM